MEKYNLLLKMATSRDESKVFASAIFLAEIFYKIYGPHSVIIEVLETLSVAPEHIEFFKKLFNDEKYFSRRYTDNELKNVVSFKWGYALGVHPLSDEKIQLFKHKIKELFCYNMSLVHLFLLKYEDEVLLYC